MMMVMTGRPDTWTTTMTNRSKSLGYGLERRVVNRANKKPGMHAQRQPGSGIYRDHPNDVVVEIDTRRFRLLRLLVECKLRSDRPSLTKLLEWLEYVETNAARTGDFDGALLVYADKGSQHLRALMDFDLLLDLLALLPQTAQTAQTVPATEDSATAEAS